MDSEQKNCVFVCVSLAVHNSVYVLYTWGSLCQQCAHMPRVCISLLCAYVYVCTGLRNVREGWRQWQCLPAMGKQLLVGSQLWTES